MACTGRNCSPSVRRTGSCGAQKRAACELSGACAATPSQLLRRCGDSGVSGSSEGTLGSWHAQHVRCAATTPQRRRRHCRATGACSTRAPEPGGLHDTDSCNCGCPHCRLRAVMREQQRSSGSVVRGARSEEQLVGLHRNHRTCVNPTTLSCPACAPAFTPPHSLPSQRAAAAARTRAVAPTRVMCRL